MTEVSALFFFSYEFFMELLETEFNINNQKE